MPGVPNSTEFPIYCKNCGQKNTKSYGWIKRHAEFICVCGTKFDTTEIQNGIAEVDGIVSRTEFSPSDFDIDRLPPEIFSAIGRLIAWWGYLEFQLVVIIGKVTKLPEDTGRVLLIGGGVKVLCATVRTLMRSARWVSEKGIREDLKKLVHDIEEVSDKRNDYAHGVFGYDKDNNVFVLHQVRSWHHRLTPEDRPIDAESLEALSDEAQELWIRAHGITRRLRTWPCTRS